jgi:type III secretion protein U
MADNSTSEKTEEPTPKRLRDARKKGQVAKSKEIVSTVLIIGLFSLLWGLRYFFLEHAKNLLQLPVSFINLPFKDALSKIVMGITYEFIIVSIPFVCGAFILGVVGNLIQFGFLVSFEPIKPDFKKINPVEGFKRLFNLDNLVEFVKSIAKVCFLGFFVYMVIKNHFNILVRMPYMGANGIIFVIETIIKKLMIYSSLCFIVLSFFDHFYQKFSFTKKNKMTKDEVKREHKEMEGDPDIKRERKKIHGELIASDNAQGVKKSTVIVTNPTHVAVGVYYKRGETPLPQVTVKGVEIMALQIIKMADDAGVPVYQNPKLARELYSGVQIGGFVPSNLLPMVAQVLRWVYQMPS